MTDSAAARLFFHLQNSREEVAFIQRGRAITFGELDRQARSYAASLANLGVERGDRVGVFLDGCIELIVALVGNYYVGAVHVPINTRYGAVEIEHILNDSGARTLVCTSAPSLAETIDSAHAPALKDRVVVGSPRRAGDHAFADLVSHAPIAAPVEPADEDVALLIYTSGTTGRSKGVELPHRAVVGNIDALTNLWEWTPDDVLVLALPLFHVHGLCIGVHGVLLRGCRGVIHERFDAGEVISELAQGGTIFMGVPTMYTKLVEELDREPERGDWLRDVRLFTSGSAALSPSVFERFEDHTGHRILERYGMSETLLTLSNPYRGERRPGTVGKPVPGCEVRVVDDDLNDVEPGQVGQIVVRGLSLMRGYRDLPDQTEEAFQDGWFLTGDVATISSDGYVSIVGRRSVDIIKSGGYKISAREIEEVLERHESVSEVAVVGLADEVWGQRIACAVVPSPNSDTSGLLADLQAFCEGEIADYKRPRDLIVVDEIPRNALGKVQKHRVIELFEKP